MDSSKGGQPRRTSGSAKTGTRTGLVTATRVDWWRELPNLAVIDVEGDVVWETDGSGVATREGGGAGWDGAWGSARSISTYPVLPTGQRDGDPNADHAWIRLYPNRALVALADGCNWGHRPREAARSAVQALKDYLTNRREIPDLHEAAHYLLRGFAEADRKIMEGKEETWEAGTTTLIGGLLLQLDAHDRDSNNRQHNSVAHRDGNDDSGDEEGGEGEAGTEESTGGSGKGKGQGPTRKRVSQGGGGEGAGRGQWGFVCCSVGDCKAFHYAARRGKVTDITAGNRVNVTDVRDPGGRLGPYLEGGAPDLRNLKLYFIPCEPGDMLLIFSDGVHDNFDPQMLGKLPQEVGLNLTQGWDEAGEESPEVEAAKDRYRGKLLKRILQAGPLTPKAVTERLLDHCFTTTRACREYMEQNPQARQPTDYRTYPGKMDHTTASCLLIPTHSGYDNNAGDCSSSSSSPLPAS